MRTLIFTMALSISLAVPAYAHAWTWGRFYPTGYAPAAGNPVPAVIPVPAAPIVQSANRYQPSYQTYAYPGYSLNYPGYYEFRERGAGDLYGGPYRAFSYPGSAYFGKKFTDGSR